MRLPAITPCGPGWALCCLPLLCGVLLSGCGRNLGSENAAYAQPRGAVAEQPHPLSPLTEAEIRTAVSAAQAERNLGRQVRFPLVALHEPPKAAVLAGNPGPRKAFLVAYDIAANITAEIVVNLEEKRVESLNRIERAQPFILNSEADFVPDVILDDPRIQEALVRRGYNDRDQVQVDTWAPGTAGLEEFPAGTRLGRCIFYDMSRGLGYAHPIGGLEAVIDLTTREVVRVNDLGPVPVAESSDRFFRNGAAALLRDETLRLRISQPNGPGFTVRGHEVAWENWKFVFANHPREGLVIHQASLRDGDRWRSVLYRGSLSEMVVPYGDPDPQWTWRAPVDAGEYGMGHQSQPLRLGVDVPDNTMLRDCMFADEYGLPRLVRNCVGLYERDGGLLWKHVDEKLRGPSGRRGRELVVTQIMTVGNYDYGLAWVFTQDGQIQVEVELAGVILTKGTAAAACERCAALEGAAPGLVPTAGEDRFGTLVAPRVMAPLHQHFFSFRLDLDVDGPANSVVEMNFRRVAPAELSPAPVGRNAFMMEETLLDTELKAQRDLDFSSQRHWKVFQPGERNSLGHFPGFMLAPRENAPAYLALDAPARRRARFIDHAVWFTRQHDAEIFSAGNYPNQSAPDQGLPQFAADDEPVINQDLVLWYTLGVTHIPRPEEWPVMPVERAGFRLVPREFFTRNPSVPER